MNEVSWNWTIWKQCNWCYSVHSYHFLLFLFFSCIISYNILPKKCVKWKWVSEKEMKKFVFLTLVAKNKTDPCFCCVNCVLCVCFFFLQCQFVNEKKKYSMPFCIFFKIIIFSLLIYIYVALPAKYVMDRRFESIVHHGYEFFFSLPS